MTQALSTDLDLKFKIDYHLMTSAEKSVYNYLWWFCKNFRTVCPSQKHIAKQTGLTRETVNRALAKLGELGFVSWFYRHWKTCVYFIADSLKALDPRKKETFRIKESEMSHDTSHLDKSKSVKDIRSRDGINSNEETKRDMLAWLDLPQDQVEHFLRYPTNAIYQACYDCIGYAKDKVVQSMPKLLQKRIKKYLK